MWIRCIIYMKCVPLTIRFQTTKQNDVIAALIQSASFISSLTFICIYMHNSRLCSPICSTCTVRNLLTCVPFRMGIYGYFYIRVEANFCNDFEVYIPSNKRAPTKRGQFGRLISLEYYRFQRPFPLPNHERNTTRYQWSPNCINAN